MVGERLNNQWCCFATIDMPLGQGLRKKRENKLFMGSWVQ